MTQPFYQASPALEQFILDVAPLHVAAPVAPETYEQLCDYHRNNPAVTDPFLVYDGGCEHTIFSKPAVNHALRAWHDQYHVDECKNFSLEDELDVAEMHIKDAEALAPEYCLTEHDIDVLYLEIAAQRTYYAIHGTYVVEQDRFIKACLDRGMATVLASKEVF